MEVKLGAAVYGAGGKKIGHVDGVVANAGTKRVHTLLVDPGILDRSQHLVAVSAITRVDAEGLYLDAPRSQVDDDAPVLDSEEVAFSQRVPPETVYIPASGVGGPVVADQPAAPGEYPDNSSFFELAPIDPPPVEIESNLGENDVKLRKGTDVLSSDRHKIGEVAGFDLGDMGLIERLYVSEGLIFKKSETFALSQIGEIDSNAIHLTVSREEAERL